MHITTASEYRRYRILHTMKNWPADPVKFYGKSWPGWRNFLGTAEQSKYIHVAELIKILIDLRITGIKEYRFWQPNYATWPPNPFYHYKHSWPGWTRIKREVENT